MYGQHRMCEAGVRTGSRVMVACLGNVFLRVRSRGVRLPTKVLPRDHPVLAKAVAFMQEIAEAYMKGEVEIEDLAGIRKTKLEQLQLLKPMTVKKVLKRPASNQNIEKADNKPASNQNIEKADIEKKDKAASSPIKRAARVASLLIAPAAIPPSWFERAVDELEAAS